MPRPRKPFARAVLGLGVILSFATQAAAPTRNHDAWTVDAVRTLVVRGDARSLATAAMLVQTANRPEGIDGLHGIDLAERAALASPGDRAIGWIRFRVCELTPGCDVPGAATTLRWTDADNAAPWLSTLAAAMKDKDDQAQDRALAGLSEGKRFYLYWNPAAVLVFDAYKAVGITGPRGGATSDHARLDLAAALSASIVVPAFRPLMDACRETQGRQRRREFCIKIAGLLQRADAVSSQLEGYAIQRRLYAPDSKEARSATDHQKNLESRKATAGKFETAFLPWFNNRLALHRLALMRQFPREEDVLNAVLREHHINGETPHD